MGSSAMGGMDEDDDNTDAAPMRRWHHRHKGRGTPIQIIINIGPDNRVETGETFEGGPGGIGPARPGWHMTGGDAPDGIRARKPRPQRTMRTKVDQSPYGAEAIPPKATQRAALFAALLRAASSAFGMGTCGESLCLVEHILRLFAVEAGLGAEAGGAIASIGTAWIFLVPGLDWQVLWSALVVGRRVWGRRSDDSSHSRGIPPTLDGGNDAGAGWIRCRNDRWRRQFAILACGPSPRTFRDDDCFCQLSRCRATWSTPCLRSPIIYVCATVCLRSSRRYDGRIRGASLLHPSPIVKATVGRTARPSRPVRRSHIH